MPLPFAADNASIAWMPPAAGESQTLTWAGIYNVRDLGGLATSGGAYVRTDALFRSDDVAPLTDQGWAQLCAAGVKTIVDLRDEAEAESQRRSVTRVRCSEAEIDLVTIPLRAFGLPEDREALATRNKIEQYTVLVDRFSVGIAAACAAVAGARSGGVLVHCTAGRDRTGVVVALLLAVAGVTGDQIATDYALSQACLAPRYERAAKWAKSEEQRQRLLSENESQPETMAALLDHIDRHHQGAIRYLRAAGMTQGLLDRVQERLC